ncbi:MAG: 2-aminoethylphosphonate--pyruvate transaminase [Burkholderiales bacterium]|nr:2-aminoethylphosphonate--pyruvate transaminase [Burkholderiales bacterium]
MSALDTLGAPLTVRGDPLLLTPGPLTTSAATKAAMLHDRGSWDAAFNAITAEVCADLLAIVHGQGSHVCVPMQGSGTFAVEAALGTLVPRDGRVLVPNNGAYCERMLRILGVLSRESVELRFDESEPVDAARVEAALRADPAITHVAFVHCETGTGMLNPLQAVAEAVARQGRRLVVDAMSSFGVLPIDVRDAPIDAVVSASGKCLEGVPGMGFVIARRETLEAAAGVSHSLALDLHDQWRYLQRTTQWRFTPPTHVVAALREALSQYRAEGGLAARRARYSDNCAALVAGMRGLGFEPFLPPGLQAPIIVTFRAPTHPAWRFDALYARMRDRGFILYPGKLTLVDTFRIGCIGAIGRLDIDAMIGAMAETLDELGIAPGA